MRPAESLALKVDSVCAAVLRIVARRSRNGGRFAAANLALASRTPAGVRFLFVAFFLCSS